MQASHLVAEFGTLAISVADHRSRSVAYSRDERALYERVANALRCREASHLQRSARECVANTYAKSGAFDAKHITEAIDESRVEPGTIRHGLASSFPDLGNELASRGGRSVAPVVQGFSIDLNFASFASENDGENSTKKKGGQSLYREYRFLFQDHTGQDNLMFGMALDDIGAIEIAKSRQHGLAVEIWDERRHVIHLPASPLTVG